ncbi:MAG: single-stranded DNA-binding protein [Microbacterium sp.]|uniref:single-stranded DNA-binding protein n=1 Tax=Microbacterium sp. TaxID=51671 RepID=UPI001AC0768E|nr:single-stranded DNA-binding protein [Microbacterium sp.]MBN9214124.1 single-stranded DNA-binding protein [Microbacterium sp.]
MSNDNVITIVGNLTADPELRYTQNGLPVANLTIVQSDRVLDRQTNEWKDGEPTFLRASVWREFAEHVAGSLTKGQRVIATGKLKQQNYKNREGNDRTGYELEIHEIGASLKFGTTTFTKAAKSDQAQSAAPAAAPVAQAAPVSQPVAQAAPAAPAAPAPQPVGVSAGQALSDDAF